MEPHAAMSDPQIGLSILDDIDREFDTVLPADALARAAFALVGAPAATFRHVRPEPGSAAEGSCWRGVAPV